MSGGVTSVPSGRDRTRRRTPKPVRPRFPGPQRTGGGGTTPEGGGDDSEPINIETGFTGHCSSGPVGTGPLGRWSIPSRTLLSPKDSYPSQRRRPDPCVGP